MLSSVLSTLLSSSQEEVMSSHLLLSINREISDIVRVPSSSIQDLLCFSLISHERGVQHMHKIYGVIEAVYWSNFFMVKANDIRVFITSRKTVVLFDYSKVLICKDFYDIAFYSKTSPHISL